MSPPASIIVSSPATAGGNTDERIPTTAPWRTAAAGEKKGGMDDVFIEDADPDARDDDARDENDAAEEEKRAERVPPAPPGRAQATTADVPA